MGTFNMQRLWTGRVLDLDQYGYDVMVLTETWDTVKGKEDLGGPNRLLVGTMPDKHDPAGSLALRLSEKMAATLETAGMIPEAGSRAMYAKFGLGGGTPLVVIGVYCPPYGRRVGLEQDDVLTAVEKFVQQCGSKVIIAGDFNAQLVRRRGTSSAG